VTQELFALMFRLRGGLSRGDFGLLNPELFSMARCGTKRGVERYLSAVTRSLSRLAGLPPPPATGGAVRLGSRASGLDRLASEAAAAAAEEQGGGDRLPGHASVGDGAEAAKLAAEAAAVAEALRAGQPPPPPILRPTGQGGLSLQAPSAGGGGGAPTSYPPDAIPTEVKLAFFNEMRHAHGRTALQLSGGAILGLYHIGVAKALLEAGLLPRVICGASAGAIVAAVIGTRTNDQLIEERFFEGYSTPLHFFQV